MQKENQDNVPSYFSVGKIHGLPYRPWDGAVGSRPWNPRTTWGGYCTHGSVLFPTWHRPYVALYEVSIISQVTIGSFTDVPFISKSYNRMPNKLPLLTLSTKMLGFKPRTSSVNHSGIGLWTLCPLTKSLLFAKS